MAHAPERRSKRHHSTSELLADLHARPAKRPTLASRDSLLASAATAPPDPSADALGRITRTLLQSKDAMAPEVFWPILQQTLRGACKHR